MRSLDLGNGWSCRFYTEHGVVGTTGLIIVGPAAPQCKYKGMMGEENMCGGGVPFENSRTSKPKWKVVSWDPLTLTPSIACGCNGQHGYITNGKYIPC